MHKLYGKLRPVLYRLGVLTLARKLFSSELRTQLATRIGLAGFDVSEYDGYVLPARTHQPQIERDGVNFVADLQGAMGTSEAARQFIRAMQAVDVPVVPLQIPLFFQRSDTSDQAVSFTPEDAHYNVNIVHINPPEIPRAMESPLRHIVTDRYSIAYWHWELIDFPEKWVKLANYFDEIWVASRFIKETIEQVTDVPVVCVPIPVTVTPPQQKNLTLPIPDDRFVFLTVFTPTSNVERKNPFGAIAAFRQAFANTEYNAVLVVKTHQLETAYGKLVKEPLRQAVAEVGGILLEDTIDRDQIVQLYARCDCLVSLHRSEGFGLPIAEAMALGKPVICTGYSGNMDFTHEDNSYLVSYHLREITEADHRYFPPMRQLYQVGQLWAEPDIDHAARLMQHVVDNPTEAAVKGKRAQETIQNELSLLGVGNKIKARLGIR